MNGVKIFHQGCSEMRDKLRDVHSLVVTRDFITAFITQVLLRIFAAALFGRIFTTPKVNEFDFKMSIKKFPQRGFLGIFNRVKKNFFCF